MIFTTTAPQLPQTRLSRPALLAVSVVHIALFWLLLQTAPVQRVVRETVVMLNLPITQPLPKPPPKKVITLPKPPEPIKPIEKPVVVKKTITTPVEPLPVPPKPPEPPKPIEPPKPVEKPVVLPKPPEKVVEVQVPKEVVKEVVPETPKVVPKEVPKPVVAEVPVELPPAPVPAPAPEPVVPVAAAPAALPSPEPSQSALPAKAPSAPAAPAAPTFAPPTGLNRPISPQNSVPVVPISGGTTVASPPGSSPQPLGNMVINPLGTGINGGLPNRSGPGYPGGPRNGWLPGDLQRKSSEQLNPKKRAEDFDIEIKNVGKEDCLHPTNPSLRNGVRMLNGDCPK